MFACAPSSCAVTVKRARGTSLPRRLMQYAQSYRQKFVNRILSSEMQRPSGAKLWQIPMPSFEPRPRPCDESRRVPPLDAHEASYLAASARMASLVGKSTG